MGVTGEITVYQENLFYPGDHTKPGPADRKAIALPCEPGPANSMNIDDLRKRVNVP